MQGMSGNILNYVILKTRIYGSKVNLWIFSANHYNTTYLMDANQYITTYLMYVKLNLNR